MIGGLVVVEGGMGDNFVSWIGTKYGNQDAFVQRTLVLNTFFDQPDPVPTLYDIRTTMS